MRISILAACVIFIPAISFILAMLPNVKGCGGVLGGRSMAGESGMLTETAPVSSLSGPLLDEMGDMNPRS